MYTIDTEGLTEKIEALERLPEEIRDEVVSVLEVYGQKMVDEAKMSKTWDTRTGAAEESITYSVQGYNLVFGSEGVDYMQYLEDRNPVLRETFESLVDEMIGVIQERITSTANRVMEG